MNPEKQFYIKPINTFRNDLREKIIEKIDSSSVPQKLEILLKGGLEVLGRGTFGDVYKLTPKGISEKTKLTLDFMKRKMKEYDELKNEIEQEK